MTVERLCGWFVAATLNSLRLLWRRVHTSPVWTRLARGLFWSLVGAIVSKGSGVAGSIVVARLLGVTAFGEFAVIQSTVGLFGTFAGLGLGITATKYVAELRVSDPARCGRLLTLILTTAAVGGIVAGLALVGFAPWLAAHTLAAVHLSPLLQSGSALVLFGALQGVYLGALGGLEAFKRVAEVNWMSAVLGIPLVVGGAFMSGLPGAVWGSVLQVALGCVMGHLALVREAARSGVSLTYVPTLDDYPVLLRFSLPAFLSSVLIGPANWVCNTIVVNQHEGYEQVALLNAANQWKNLVSFLPLMMTSVLVPMLSTLHHGGQAGEFSRLLRRNLVISAGVCLTLGLPLVFLARPILGSYGPGFREGVPIFVVTLLSTAVVAVNNLLSRAMQSAGRAWLELSFSGLWAVVLVAGCLLLVPHYGAMGLVIAHTLAAAALALFQWRSVLRMLLREDSSLRLGAAGSVPIPVSE